MTIVHECRVEVARMSGNWRRARGTAVLWLRRARTRRHLRELDGEQLADIGLDDLERRRECSKWFWQK